MLLYILEYKEILRTLLPFLDEFYVMLKESNITSLESLKLIKNNHLIEITTENLIEFLSLFGVILNVAYFTNKYGIYEGIGIGSIILLFSHILARIFIKFFTKFTNNKLYKVLISLLIILIIYYTQHYLFELLFQLKQKKKEKEQKEQKEKQEKKE